MLEQQTLQQLTELRLYGMAQALEEQKKQLVMQDLTFEERLAFLIDKEATYRKDRRLQRLLRSAKLRHNACVEDINYHHPRKLDKSRMISLAICTWIKEKHNLIITGPTGVGKSWLACALGNQACRYGISVKYLRLSRYLEELRIAQADGSYAKLMKQTARIQLLILDDWGIDVLKRQQRNDLLEILEDRHQISSTIVTSQLPIEKWHDFIGEATIADAILDRLIHNAYRLNLQGDSMRKAMTKKDDPK